MNAERLAIKSTIIIGMYNSAITRHMVYMRQNKKKLYLHIYSVPKWSDKIELMLVVTENKERILKSCASQHIPRIHQSRHSKTTRVHSKHFFNAITYEKHSTHANTTNMYKLQSIFLGCTGAVWICLLHSALFKSNISSSTESRKCTFPIL